MIVDTHCHFLSPKVLDLVDGFATRQVDDGEAELYFGDRRLGPMLPRLNELSILMEDSDRFGVDVRALCGPSWLHCYWAPVEWGTRFARAMNDTLAEAVAQHPDRLVGLATVPLQDVDAAIAELRRAVGELGFRGVATVTHVERRYFDDPTLWPFLEAAADLDVPVFLHPHDVAGVDRMDRFRLVQMLGNPHEATFALARTVLSGVLDRIPGLKLCFVQVGGSLPAVLGRMDHTWHARSETRVATRQPPSTYLPRLYFDSIAHSAEPIEFLLRHVPDEQIVMGSDYPWDMGEPQPGQSIRALTGSTPESVERMLGGNAARLLRLDHAGSAG